MRELSLCCFQACLLTVPKYIVFHSGTDEDTYLRQLGYKISTDEDTAEARRLQQQAWGLQPFALGGPPHSCRACASTMHHSIRC